MKKTYVLDTNVLLQSPHALFSFDENDVVIPEVVLEELDRFKRENSEIGANARQTARIIDELRLKGSLTDGVELPGGGTLRIELNFTHVQLPASWPGDTADNRILKICKGLQDKGENAILVTRDIFERIKGDIIGVTAQDFITEQVPTIDRQYRGRCEVYTTSKKLSDFYETGHIKPRDVYAVDPEGERIAKNFLLNEFVLLMCESNLKQSALGRFDGRDIVALDYLEAKPFGVTPRNNGQRFMQEMMMRDADEAPLVIVKGAAGTAKTFYSLAVGLHKLLLERDRNFRKILVCRPNVKFDEDIGFLPGTEQEKIAPFLRPVIDNLEILVDQNEKERYKNERELRGKVEELFERALITTEAIAYIRGRSIARNWVIIDEAQNLTPKQVKGIITRVGKGTKIILIGDPEQIDHPFLDSRTNGLCYAAERMKGSSCCWQVTMNDDECERSELAYDAARRMADKMRPPEEMPAFEEEDEADAERDAGT
jgi:PhoH-like ATPase